MAPKPLKQNEKPGAPTAGQGEDEQPLPGGAAMRGVGGKAVASPPPDADEDEDLDDDLELDDDEEDEDLVVFTAKEAAGALATVYRFVKPFLANYKTILA